jgi:hypothetical protein
VRAEEREEAPAVLLTVTDRDGNVIRRLTGPTAAGFHRVSWDFRWPDPSPTSLTPRQRGEFENPGGGPLTPPGTYKVQLAKRINGVISNLGAPQEFASEGAQQRHPAGTGSSSARRVPGEGGAPPARRARHAAGAGGRAELRAAAEEGARRHAGGRGRGAARGCLQAARPAARDLDPV